MLTASSGAEDDLKYGNRKEDAEMRIEIAGALSCGKSTLARLLSKAGHYVVYEDLSTNPYLDLRVQDPEKYDFLCQRQFVLDKIASLAHAESLGCDYFTDFSIAAERAYVTRYLSDRPASLEELMGIMDRSESDQGLPDLVVYLKCHPQEQLQRIRKRGRAFEQGHTVGFIDGINCLVRAQIMRLKGMGVEVVEYQTDVLSWDAVLNDLTGAVLPSAGYVCTSSGETALTDTAMEPA
jgi:deoxyadenosine/deoxycytidine kinase